MNQPNKFTETQIQEFRQEYQKRKTRQWILAGVIIAFILPIIFLEEQISEGLWGLSPGAWIGLFAAVVFGGLIFSFKNWRCPACNRYFGKTLRIKFCPGCGVPLSGK